MARLNLADVENYSSNETSWFKLKNNGDVARVQFPYHSMDDVDIFAVHKVMVGGKERLVDCKRKYDDPIDDCPFCAKGMKVSPQAVILLYDIRDKKIKLWTRGRAFLKKLESLINRYGDISKMVFEIERVGEAGSTDTTYEIFPMPEVTADDISSIEKPELLGGFILNKTPEEMQIYIDTNSFPETNTNKDAPITRRASDDSAPRSRRSF